MVKHKMEYSCYMKVDFSSLNSSTFVIRNNKYVTTGTYRKLSLANGLTMFSAKLINACVDALARLGSGNISSFVVFLKPSPVVVEKLVVFL